ncbi:MAG: MFS transporter [Mycobacteriales bacterium]
MTRLAVGTRDPEPTRARTAVLGAFVVNGLCFASWLPRTPAVKDALSLSSGQLGLLLLCLSGGAFAAVPMSGPAVHRLGAARVVWLGSATVGLGLTGLGAGLITGIVWFAAVGLAITGAGMSTWDVAMNIEGAAVEHRRGRPLMPLLHGVFSIGTLAGGGLAVVSSTVGLPLTVQVLGTALVAPLSMAIITRSFLPASDPEPDGQRVASGSLRAWLEPRTLLIGLFTLAFAFTEGSANDWTAVALVDGHHTGEAFGAVGFGAFVLAMTVGRLSGVAVLERHGRVPVLRGIVVIAMTGVLLVILAPFAALALVGALLWGLGASLGFPIGMSAAADEPARAAVRVSVVGSISYTASLAGPPLIGLLAEHVGILRALIVVAGALIVAALAAPAARPPVKAA